MMRAELLQYNITYDRQEKDVGFIVKQLETHLRERFNVLVSTVEYGIKNGHLVREGTKEPFIDSIKRGRDIIQKLSPNNVDTDRENAEVVGFEKIDSFLSNPATPLGAKMLSISPAGGKGSKYQHNFYDIFTLKERSGKRYVELYRYSSGLSSKAYAQRLRLPSEDLMVKDFLANPIKITDQNLTSEDIHKLLHICHKYMDDSEFTRIWNSYLVQFFVKRYQLDRSARSFNAILNAADEVWQNKEKEDKYKFIARDTISYDYVRVLEEKKVRQAGGQCPGKSGADADDSPFSVSEFSGFGKDRGYDFDHDGTCVACKEGPRALGPCEICEQCVAKIEKEENLIR